MAVIVKTGKPQELLDAIKLAIDENRIDTWVYDQSGDFTHVPEQWYELAWLRPEVGSGQLKFKILRPEGKNITQVVRGVYHGRFIEMLINHFEKDFDIASAP